MKNCVIFILVLYKYENYEFIIINSICEIFCRKMNGII